MKSNMACLMLVVIVSIPLCLRASLAQGRGQQMQSAGMVRGSHPLSNRLASSNRIKYVRGIRGEWIVVGHDGNIYCSRGSQVWMKKPNGKVLPVAGEGSPGNTGDGGPAIYAQLTSPTGLAVGPHGSLYIADLGNNNIRRVNSAGIITTVAGTGVAGFSGDGGPAIHAELKHPMGLAIGPHGSIYVVDQGNSRVRKITPSGTISTVAGDGVCGFSGDGGPAVHAEMSSPMGIAVDRLGNIYIADWGNRRVREVSAHGIITTIAGNGYWGDYGPNGNGGPATSAELSGPRDVTVGKNGAIYIDDDWDGAIREASPDGILSTFVHKRELGDVGHGAIACLPVSSAIGPHGDFYFAEELIGVRQVYFGPEGLIREVKVASSRSLAKKEN